MLLLILLIFAPSTLTYNSRRLRDYASEREAVFAAEDSMFLGSDEILTPDEVIANNYLMGLKVNEKKAKYAAEAGIC